MPTNSTQAARARHRVAIATGGTEMRARDAHRTASLLALLVLIWGFVSLLATPWEPFWRVNLGQSLVCALALPYFVRTWWRPDRRVAERFTALVIVYTLLLLPWTSMVWCRLGRPVEAFTMPEIAMISMALMLRPPLWLNLLVVSLFGAVGVFAWFYAQHVGVGALRPVTEPFGLFYFFALAVGICVLRRNRRELARHHIVVQAELQALDRIRPMFLRARDQLRTQLANIVALLPLGPRVQRAGTSRAIGGAIDRLSELSSTLGDVTDDVRRPSTQAAEQRLLAHDAQFGAMVLAAISLAIAVPSSIWSYVTLGGALTPLFVANGIIAAASLVYLVATRRRPSSRRALLAVLVVFVGVLPLATYNQLMLLELDRPYAPFLAHKLLMVSLALTVAARFRFAVALIGTTIASAMAMWFALDLGAHRDLIPMAEPWITLTILLISLVSARLLEQRRIASVHLLRAEAEASALHRRAVMLLALRDRLNSPLQTLVVGVTGPSSPVPAGGVEQVDTAVEELVGLSRDLAQLDWLVPAVIDQTSFDADHELRRRT